MAKADVTPERLRDLLNYDPETGVFTWKVATSWRVKVGQVAGYRTGDGYVGMCVAYRRYKAHRLAWMYVYGEWPKNDIDHINGDRLDNRILNLRDVTRAVNLQNQRGAHPNNRNSLLGASWLDSMKSWRAIIQANGVRHELGYFSTAEEAHQAYLVAKRRLHEGCTI